MRTLRVISLSLLLCSLMAALPAAAPARPFQTGILDPVFAGANPSRWLDLTKRSGGSFVRIHAFWNGALRGRRPSNPCNPQDPAYDWSSLQASVSEANRKKLRVLLTIHKAPAWAEGRNKPSWADPGSWRPSPAALGGFACALAKRFPGVNHFQVWNEPNLSKHLAPGWVKRRGKLKPFAPKHYRKMLNAAYEALKRDSRGNFVVTAGMAPYGDLRPRLGKVRTPPALFVRELLCLNNRLRPKRCPTRPKLDALSQHLYHLQDPPRTKARNRDDVKILDIRAKVKRPLRKATRAGLVRPRGRKQIWVTELGWESRPPAPHGIPLARHARYLEEALYLLWRQGVAVTTWLRIVDGRSTSPNHSYTGLYRSGGGAKPARQAHRFPFVTERVSKKKVRYWGRAPGGGRVKVQVKRGGWRTVARDRTGQSRVFTGTIRMKQRGSKQRLRATFGREASLTWKQK